MSVVTEADRRKLDAFNTWHHEGQSILQKALEIDEKYSGAAKKREAIQQYEKALTAFQNCLRSIPRAVPTKQKTDIETRIATVNRHILLVQGRLADLSDGISGSSMSAPACGRSYTDTNSTATTTNTSAKKTGLSALFSSQAEQEILGCVVNLTGISLSDVIGNNAAKQALEESVLLPALNPAVFTGLRAPAKGILLFGPPGNGKTMLAKAIASEARCTFFNISAATIMSKWVGEGEKMMRELFRIARNRQPAIIFIDEIDSMLCSRGEDENGASRRVKTEFLLQFDGITSANEDRILVLGATNRPFELDDGVLRRFSRRIYIDLPDANARKKLIVSNFERSKTRYNLSSSELLFIADQTNGYSFSDLTALCKEAAMGPIRELSRSQLERASANRIRPVQFTDISKSMTVIRPSTSPANQQKLIDFATNFAQTQ